MHDKSSSLPHRGQKLYVAICFPILSNSTIVLFPWHCRRVSLPTLSLLKLCILIFLLSFDNSRKPNHCGCFLNISVVLGLAYLHDHDILHIEWGVSCHNLSHEHPHHSSIEYLPLNVRV